MTQRQTVEKQHQIELARCEAARARRQYDAVDPLERELGSLVRLRPPALSTEERLAVKENR